jgi:hypothetical protein
VKVTVTGELKWAPGVRATGTGEMTILAPFTEHDAPGVRRLPETENVYGPGPRYSVGSSTVTVIVTRIPLILTDAAVTSWLTFAIVGAVPTSQKYRVMSVPARR